jgi:hypothetical protein
LFCASLLTVAVNICVLPPACTFALAGATATLIAGGATNVIAAALALLPSVTAVAVSVTSAGEGTPAGAEYVIATPEALLELESVPQLAPLQPTPLSVQLTPLFCVSSATVALNCFVPPGACTFAEPGVTVTVIAAGGFTVIVAVPDLVVSATAVAVSEIIAGEGPFAGAVY